MKRFCIRGVVIAAKLDALRNIVNVLMWEQDVLGFADALIAKIIKFKSKMMKLRSIMIEF